MKLNLEKLDVYAFAGFAMGFFIMYYVFIVVDPTYRILDEIVELGNNTNELANSTNQLANDIKDLANNTNQIANQSQVLTDYAIKQNELTINQSREAIEQNNRIIENQNNNTKTLDQAIQAIDQAIKENRLFQEQSILYLITVLNQSNVIGNKTADDIQKNIETVQELERNQTQERRDQTMGIIKGFSLLLQDSDEELDKIRKIMVQLAVRNNVTVSDEVLTDEFQVDPQSHTFTFPNGTTLSFAELFKPAALLTRTGEVYNDTSGQISGFLGGQLITNESIPLELRSLLRNQSNTTANATPNISSFLGGLLIKEAEGIDATTNESGEISSFLGGPMITSEDVAELNSNISAQAQNQSQPDLSQYGTPS